MCIKFNHSAHIRIWDWLSKNPKMNKRDWPEWDYNGGNIPRHLYECFACDYAERSMPEDRDSYLLAVSGNYCTNCPLSGWAAGAVRSTNRNFQCESIPGGGYTGLHEEWLNAEGDEEKRKEIAEKIRDLPVREGVECE